MNTKVNKFLEKKLKAGGKHPGRTFLIVTNVLKEAQRQLDGEGRFHVDFLRDLKNY